MLNRFYGLVTSYPKWVILMTLLVTAYLATLLNQLYWETDARVYLPKGHAAIEYDEKVDDIFGVKNPIIIGIVNEEKGIYNQETLALISRITEQVAGLSGVEAIRTLDVTSLSTASAFVGDETSVGTDSLMPSVPENQAEIDQLVNKVNLHADLFVGNIVSEDGSAAVIRAKLKEGKEHRYSTYWQVKGILNKELGGADSAWAGNQWSSGGWDKTAENGADDSDTAGSENKSENSNQQWPSESGSWQDSEASTQTDNGDKFYLAGRPVIEVTSGLDAMDDIKVMVPLLMVTVVIILFLIFKNLRCVVLPLFVMSASVIWTLGVMVLFDVPLFTISTMMPVIIVAVGIGDAMHLLSRYNDSVLKDPYRKGSEISLEVLKNLGPPLMTTTVTTSIGFLALLFAEMPPFKIFGLFTVFGIVCCWILTVTFIPAVLSLLQPKIPGFLNKRRSQRVFDESDLLSRVLATWSGFVEKKPFFLSTGLIGIVLVSLLGAKFLIVDSSWMSDFRDDNEVSISNDLLNEKFSGTVFLNVVIEGDKPNALKSPELLAAIESLQDFVESQPLVGDSLSIVDFLKSVNKNLHTSQVGFDVLPTTKQEISEYLFLLSMSGRPEILREVIDYEYRQANISFLIKTDHTKELKKIIDEVNQFSDEVFSEFNVKVNLAGTANNSYVWADLLIDSLATAIILSKIGIFLIAWFLFRSVVAGLITIVPVSLTTLIVAGGAGYFNIPLDVSTALAAGVAIGVGVDYTIHYLFKYRQAMDALDDHAHATLVTMRSVGKTIVLNAVVVTAGFLVLSGSQFPPHVKLGYFVAIYMVLSCIAALMVLPLLSKFDKGRLVG